MECTLGPIRDDCAASLRANTITEAGVNEAGVIREIKSIVLVASSFFFYPTAADQGRADEGRID